MTTVDLGIVPPEYQAEFEKILAENGGDLNNALMIINARHGVTSKKDSGATITHGDNAPTYDSSFFGGVIEGARKIAGRKIPSLRQESQQQINNVAQTVDIVSKLREPAFLTFALLAIFLTVAALSELSIKSAVAEVVTG